MSDYNSVMVSIVLTLAVVAILAAIVFLIKVLIDDF